jgi:hypothetical protein
LCSPEKHLQECAARDHQFTSSSYGGTGINQKTLSTLGPGCTTADVKCCTTYVRNHKVHFRISITPKEQPHDAPVTPSTDCNEPFDDLSDYQGKYQ